MLVVFETELLGIDGVEAEPSQTLEPAKESPPAASDNTVNADNKEAPPVVPSAAPAKPAEPISAQTSPMDEEDDGGECNLLGNFALLVQGALGLLAVSSLVVKRMRESPRRPVKIWFFDVSKQVFGSVLLHLANVLMSMLSSGSFDIATNVAATPKHTAPHDKIEQPNPCSFYLLNLAIDVRLSLSLLTQYTHSMLTTTDHHRHPDSSPPFKDSPPWIRSHTPCRSTRVHSQRQLRPAASRSLVAQAIHDLLFRPHWHEIVRSCHLHLPSMDCVGW